VRVAQFHSSTIKALAEVIAAAGLTHPDQLRPHHISKRIGTSEVKSYAELYPWLKPGELLQGSDDHAYRHAWAIASADSFTPLVPTEVEEAQLLT
jgi:hypothetical protein